MFREYDCFRLKKAIPNESIPLGTVGVVLMILYEIKRVYEVEFPDGNGGNLGSEMTFTLDEEYMDIV